MPVVARRVALGGLVAFGAELVASCTKSGSSAAVSSSAHSANRSGSHALDLARLEQRFGRRIGVAALDTATGRTALHRAHDRFLMCSTGKVATVATVLHAAERDRTLLSRLVRYERRQLVAHSPVTSAHVTDGLTISQLCAAALSVSDNTAENLLLSGTGGPDAVTSFVRSLGDRVSRFDRTEPELNVSVAAGLDTTTPSAMLGTLRRVLLAPVTAPASRQQLAAWMRACATGAQQIRAGTPAGWTVADKTGSGADDESNDIAMLTPPRRRQILLCVYTAIDASTASATRYSAASGPAAIAAATRSALAALSK